MKQLPSNKDLPMFGVACKEFCTIGITIHRFCTSILAYHNRINHYQKMLNPSAWENFAVTRILLRIFLSERYCVVTTLPPTALQVVANPGGLGSRAGHY